MFKAIQVQLDPREQQVQLALKEKQVYKAIQVQLDPREHQVLKEKQGLQVLLVQLAHEEKLGLQAPLA